MTIKELCDVFSKEIDATFDASKDEIKEQLLDGTTAEMTAEQIYVKLILNSMRISANLAVQPMLAGLVQMGIIPKGVLETAKLKPDIRLVKTSQESDSMDPKAEKKVKVAKGLTEERCKKIRERLNKGSKNFPLNDKTTKDD